MKQELELEPLIERWNEGDSSALALLVEVLYDDLRGLAHRHLRSERSDHTLNTTALVNELYLALSDRTQVDWRGRPQLLGLTSSIMRHLLVDHARRRGAEKRGGGQVRVSFDAVDRDTEAESFDVLMIDDALNRLGEQDERLARIVEYRFFGGMDTESISEALGCSARTVRRSWVLARSFLYAALSETETAGSGA